MSADRPRRLRFLTPWTLGLLLALNVALRLVLATLPGYVADVEQYKAWALGTALAGLPAAYDAMPVDYPPLLLYPLYVVGELFLLLEPDAGAAAVRESGLLTFLVKLPHVLFDLGVAALLYVLVARGGLWGASRRGAGWGGLAALLYLWNPVVLWDSGYWGQPDGLHSLLALGALAALGTGRSGLSGAALALAALAKPLAAPLVPLVALASLLRGGVRGAARWAAAALAAAAVAFLPFIVTGRLPAVVRRVWIDIDTMPLTSANAHNLWWLLLPWREANAAWLGPLAPRTIALALFGAAYVLLLWRIRERLGRTADGAAATALLLSAGAAVSASFFFLSTHLHENHLFLALVLVLPLAGRDRRFGWLALGFSVAALLNMLLHDLDLPYRLPGILGAPSPELDPYLKVPYTWAQRVGTRLNALLVAGLTLVAYAAAWRGIGVGRAAGDRS